MRLTNAEEEHSNSPPDNKVLGEEVWGLEDSCCSWNRREAVKLDLAVTSAWLLVRTLRSQIALPFPEEASSSSAKGCWTVGSY